MQALSGAFGRRQRHAEEERWGCAPGKEEAGADAQQPEHS